MWSRQGKDLTRYLPDLQEAIDAQVPGCVLDGEAVIWTADRLDFDALQRRQVASKTGLSALIQEQPASFVAFDLLAVAGHDIRDTPLRSDVSCWSNWLGVVLIVPTADRASGYCVPHAQAKRHHLQRLHGARGRWLARCLTAR